MRPLIKREISEKKNECIKLGQNISEIVVADTRRFTFDHIFDTYESQEGVYDKCVSELLESLFSGYHATSILKYKFSFSIWPNRIRKNVHNGDKFYNIVITR